MTKTITTLPLALAGLALLSLWGCGSTSDQGSVDAAIEGTAVPPGSPRVLHSLGYGSDGTSSFAPSQDPALRRASVGPVTEGTKRLEAIGYASAPAEEHEEELLDEDTELVVIERTEAALTERAMLCGSGEMLVALRDEVASLPLEHTGVTIDVLGPVATGSVTQRFTNPYDEPIEARYVFPLPHDAAVHDFLLTIGDRKIRGVVRERDEARRIYEAARAQGYTAALMTQERPNVFTQNVANILPGKTIDVTLAYLEPVDLRDGWHELAFPMVVGPRYNPVGFDDGIGAKARGASSTGQPTDVTYLRPETRPSAEIDLEVRLDVGLEVERLSSTSHDITVEESETGALVRLAPSETLPNRDFKLRWKVAGTGVRTALVQEGDHALLTLYPPTDLTELPRRPLEHHFVIDTSGSMSGEPMAVVRKALHAALDRMEPTDTFHMMEFSSSRSVLARASQPATKDNIRKARRYVDGLKGSGGTEMLPAVQEALSREPSGGRKRVITFFTDGYIGNEDQVLAAIQRREADARFFCFAIGSSPNRWLLAEMARRSEGAEAAIDLREDPTDAIDSYFARVSHPAVEELDVRVEGADADFAADVPRALFAGRPVTLPIHIGAAKGPVHVIVEGVVDGAPRQLASLSPAAKARTKDRQPVLSKVWARARLAQLMADLRTTDRRRAERLGKTMTTLALEHGLISSSTSFVCVDSAAQVTDGGDPKSVDVAVPVPAGVEFETSVKDG